MMRKFFLLTGIIFLCFITIAQRSIDGLINAEKSFAAYSVANGTKDAFLKFADSSGVIFVQEIEMPANAMEVWKKRENRPGKLDWRPEYAEIANSKDFGYTTGPYTFIRNDSVLARGEYVTVWQINKDGEWKFLLDLGVTNTPKVLSIALNKVSAGKISGNASTDNIVKAEQQFISLFKIDRKKAYEKYLSGKSILKRNGEYSLTNKKLQKKIIADDPLDSEFKMVGSGIASSGDLGYIYGTVTVGVKQFGYQRIWRKEKNGWKIALEVLRY
jgi:hypothetical protein